MATRSKFIPKTGDVIKTRSGRYCIIANSLNLDDLLLYNILPVSLAIYMASDKDFIIMDDDVFDKIPVMAELWNSLAVPIEFFDTVKKVGKLNPQYTQYLSSYLYFNFQNRKNRELEILTGPPITSSSDIRLLFRQMEEKAFYSIRTVLINISTE